MREALHRGSRETAARNGEQESFDQPISQGLQPPRFAVQAFGPDELGRHAHPNNGGPNFCARAGTPPPPPPPQNRGPAPPRARPQRPPPPVALHGLSWPREQGPPPYP